MYMYDVGKWHRIDKQVSRINRFQNDVECAAFSRKLVAKILLNGYLTICHNMTPKTCKVYMHPFVLCTIKALTNPSLSFIFTCIELMYYMYYTLSYFPRILYFFFFFCDFPKKKNLTTSISQKNSRNRSEKKNPRFLQPLTHRHWDKKEKSSREFIIETSGNFHSLGTFLLIFL